MKNNQPQDVAQPASPTLLPKEQVCSKLGVSSRTLEGMISAGKFPPGVQLGRYKYWTQPVVQGWLSRCFAVQQAWQP